MESFIFNQLNFIRRVTLHAVKEVTESQADIVPTGFSNNIRWNLGHIYVLQEQFAFHYGQELMQAPSRYVELFGIGSKPSDWKVQTPSLSELIDLLQEQPKRIAKQLHNRLDEAVVSPLTIHKLTLQTIGEYLTFSLYHEGCHTQTIKMMKKLI